VEKEAPPSTLWEQAFLEVGLAGRRTLRDYKAANPSLGGRSKWSADTLITLPYSTRYASNRLRSLSQEQLASVVDRLKADPAVIDINVGRAVLIPHLSSAQVSAMSNDCAALPAEKTWVFGVSTADEISRYLPRATDTTIVAILDSGIPEHDDRFKFWQNPEPNTEPGNYNDEDHCLDDYIGCNCVMRAGFPLDDIEEGNLCSHGTHVAGLASGRLLPQPLLAELDRRIRLMILKHFISEIDTEMIERYRQMRVEQKTRLGRKRSPLRVNKEMQVLSSIFTLALEKQLIASRPRTTMFRVSSERIRYLTPDEETRLFGQLDNCEWLKPIVLIALHTGMRRGEICNLQWFDLNFDRGLIHIRNTKNGKDRIIPMNATVRQLLETQRVLRARKAQENAEKGKSQVPSPYVFPSPRTEKRLVEIKYSFVRAVKQAKITDLRFHDLRHTQRHAWVTPAQTLSR